MRNWLAILAVLALSLAFTPDNRAFALSCQQGPFFIFFEHGQAFVTPDARVILDNAVSSAGNCGYAKTTIARHIDTSESHGLDGKRARTVKAYLIARGFPEEDVEIHEFGASMLRMPTGPDTPEKQNRRVEISYSPFEDR